MEFYYDNYMTKLKTALDNISFKNETSAELGKEEGMQYWQYLTENAAKTNQNFYFIGNGASAAMASHMSADACKNGHLKAQCLNDISLMTAISNDVDYKQVYSLQLERYASENDVLFTISSSGNSPNVICAIEKALELNMKVVTLSALKEDNKSRKLGHLNVFIPADRYGFAESGHQAILHCWLDQYLNNKGIDI